MLNHLGRVTLGALFVVLSFGVGNAETEPGLFGKGAQLVVHSQIQLEPPQRRGLSWLRYDMQYFGAMAIVPGTNVWSAFRGFHSWDNAISVAKVGCGLQAVSAGENPKACILYASVLPRSLDPTEAASRGYGKLPSGLGQNAYGAFVGDYQRRQKPNKFGAFAISGFAQDGYSYGLGSETAARDHAIGACEASLAKALIPYPRDLRDFLRHNNLDRCWVVHVHRP